MPSNLFMFEISGILHLIVDVIYKTVYTYFPWIVQVSKTVYLPIHTPNVNPNQNLTVITI